MDGGDPRLVVVITDGRPGWDVRQKMVTIDQLGELSDEDLEAFNDCFSMWVGFVTTAAQEMRKRGVR